MLAEIGPKGTPHDDGHLEESEPAQAIEQLTVDEEALVAAEEAAESVTPIIHRHPKHRGPRAITINEFDSFKFGIK